MHVQSEASPRGIMVGIYVKRDCLCHTIYIYFSFLHILLIHVQIETVGGSRRGMQGRACVDLDVKICLLKEA